LAFWVLGFAFAFGDASDNFIGGHVYYAGDLWNKCNGATNEVTQYAFWCFHYAVAMISLAIVVGMMSERITMKASFIYSFFHLLIIYPVTVAWGWGTGWLNHLGYFDYGGAGPVFLTGAWAGLAGLVFLGSRYNKWNKYEDIYDERMMEVEMKGMRSIPVERLGEEGPYYPNVRASQDVSRQVTFINTQRLRQRAFDEESDNFGVGNLPFLCLGFGLTFIGFFFWQAGMMWGMYKSGMPLWRNAEMAAVQTFMGAFSAGLVTWLFRTPLMYGFRAPRRLRYESLAIIRGALVGIVSTLAGSWNYVSWEGVVTGIFAAIGYVIFAKIFDALKIDDPIEGFAVFGVGGCVSLMMEPFLDRNSGIIYGYDVHGYNFAYNLVGACIIPAWAFFNRTSCLGYIEIIQKS